MMRRPTSTRLLLAFYWLARARGMKPCTAWTYASSMAADSIIPSTPQTINAGIVSTNAMT